MIDRLKQFIEKAKKVHGDKYDYSKVNYINSQTKVCIICPEHGEFWQEPSAHVRGYNCPKCSNIKRGDTFRSTCEKFIEKSRKVHGDKYDYSHVKYINSSTKVKIICPKHGEFLILPQNHLLGQGCPKCAGRGLTTDEIIKKFRAVHGDRYDYSNVEYHKMHEKVCIICPEHGEFWQTPAKHVNGQNCPKCAKKTACSKKILTTEEFIEKAKQVHGDEYKYGTTKYNGTYGCVEIECAKHGIFKQRANDHLNGHGCPICGNNKSLSEDEINSFLINDLKIKTETKKRGLLKNNKEIDIFMPELNIGIEYDGLYWHNENYKDSTYHIDKTNECLEKGIRLIHIFEDEWRDKKNIVKSILSNICGKITNKIYARKCEIKEVPNKEASVFLDENHIQGKINGKINLGLFYNEELVSIMCFGDRRINMGGKKIDGEYELLRFCSKLNVNVIGGASKLFKYFIKNYEFSKIISYCDLRYSIGNIYEIIGLTNVGKTKPNYFYIVGNNRKNRFKYRKSELIKDGYDKNESEHEIMLKRGIYRIYDCGSLIFEYIKK